MLTKLKFPTLSYKYGEEEEFIFCVKGKPFPCLVSPKLPPSTETLLDYAMVRELGLKMKNLQCKRFSYANYNMRVLGTVITTVQCIQDGEMCGTTTIKADVVQDLAKNLDVECVAGQKMTVQLRGNSCTPSGALSPRASPKPKSSPKAKPSPPPPTTPQRSPSPPTPKRSPPGFPLSPQHSPPRSAAKANQFSVSPYTLNIRKLTGMFGDADLQPDTKTELETLYDADMAGDYDIDAVTGDMMFYREDGRYYYQGHGRDKCARVNCVSNKKPDIPNNCGFNTSQWYYPDGYKSCGDKCSGAFCRCIRERGRYKDLKYSI